MTPRTRRLLRWGFILVFLVVAPLIILWTAGYRYDLRKGRLERTGVIFVSSVPTGADIFIDDKLRKERTPARLTRLAPGTYRLRIEKAGFASWSDDIEVPSGGTAFVNEAVLFRQAVPTLVHEFPFTESVFAPGGRFAAFLHEEEGVAELRIADLERGVIRLPYRAERANDVPFELSWSSDGTRLLVRRPYENRPVFLVWDALRPDVMTDLRVAVPETLFVQAFWSDEGNVLYAADRSALYAVEFGASPTANVGSALEDMRVVDGIAYGFNYEKERTVFMSRPLRDNGFEAVTDLPSGRYELLDAFGGALIARVRGSERVIFIDPSKKPEEAVVFESSAKDAVWSDDGRRALYWNTLELRVFDLDKRTDDVITRSGEGLRAADWYPVGGLILFATESGLSSSDQLIRSGRIERLAGFTKLEDFALSENGTTIHFAGSIGRQTGLWSMGLR